MAGGRGSGVALPPGLPEGLPDDLGEISVPDEMSEVFFWSAVAQVGDGRG